MRPRKWILAWSEREEQLGELALVLDVSTSTNTLRCSTPMQFVSALQRNEHDYRLIVLMDNGNHALTASCAAIAAKRLPHCPLMVLADPPCSSLDILDAAAVLERGTSTEMLIDRIRILSTRKRGPRKGFKQAAQTVLAEIA